MPAEPYGAALIGPMPERLASSGCIACEGRNGARWARTATGPTPGTAAAVRDAERLVQVQVRDVAAELAGLGVAEQGVEVRAVDVDLAAVPVHDLAQLGDRVLVGPVRRRVGHHDGGQVVGVLLALRAQVVEVDGAVVGGLDHDDLHAGHHRGGGVGAVRGRRDQADVAARRRPLARW